jgi:hypothetical protein
MVFKRINRVPKGRLRLSPGLSSGASLSRPFGTKILLTGAPPTLKCWAILKRPFGTYGAPNL